MIKVLIIITVLAFVLASTFYLWIIQGVATVVGNINTNFISFIPTEIRIFISIIVFGLIIGFTYSYLW